MFVGQILPLPNVGCAKNRAFSRYTLRGYQTCITADMSAQKRILIVDEHGFSRVCSALLAQAGYGTEAMPFTKGLPQTMDANEYGLVVVSYPYGAAFLDEIKKYNLPTIILSDNIDGNLMAILNEFDNSYCMIKPLDYERFRFLVKQVMTGDSSVHGGYGVV